MVVGQAILLLKTYLDAYFLVIVVLCARKLF